MEDKVVNSDSNSGVPGFEDIEEHTSNQGQRADQESPMIQASQNSNSTSNSAEVNRSPGTNVSSRKVVESPRRSPYAVSGSRTKTMAFSQNGYSEELLKVGHLLRTVCNGKLNDGSAQEIPPPPGFESVKIIEGSDPVTSRSKPLRVDDLIPVNGFDDVPESSPPGGANGSNGSINVVRCSRGMNVEEGEQATAVFQNLPNQVPNQGQPIVTPSENVCSESKTKTVCFSHIECSEEVISSKRKLSALGGDQNSNLGQIEKPPSIVNVTPPTNTLMHPLEQAQDDAEALGKRETTNNDESSTSDLPPGFEDVIISKRKASKGTEKSKRNIDLTRRRVTRSQAKQSKKVVTRSQSIFNRSASGEKCVEGSPQASESAKTSDSIVKIAKESLEIGKLLGVKVIIHDRNVLKKITSSIKSNRSLRDNHKSKLTS